ncbi:MAG: DEAD/DEAH box helicase family protein [Deltaproteobacteria bacterium]|nr:DEAD/DEAH box helicase family protein [Myxococcales bacterium]MDP3220943.1 DEAD/DEAH box helicase family protein [Deltaproteobacteria bacterium]
MSAPLALRPYQLAAIADVYQAFRDGAESVCLQLPTGGGKTHTAAGGVIGPTVARGNRVLFIADLEEILLDTDKRLRAMGLPVGLILDGKALDPEAPVQVASQQTLAAWQKRGAALPPCNRVILDECHIAGASTVRWMLGALRERGAKLLGLTATPSRGDGQALDEFQRLVVGPQPRELVEAGALVPCEVFSPPGAQDGCAMDPVDAVRLFASDRRAIVFATTDAEATRITADLNRMGQPSMLVLGKTKKAERRAARDRLAAGDVRHLVTVRALQKGFDAPLIDTIVLTTPCTLTDYLQRVGRGVRPSPATGKTSALVVDLRGAVYVHGLPLDDRQWTLSGRQGRETLPNLRRCLDCHAIFPPARRCPRCGSCRMTDPRPLRIQQAELIAQSGVPASVRAEAHVQQRTSVLLRMKPRLTSSQARFAALVAAPAWVREALNFSHQEVRRAAR